MNTGEKNKKGRSIMMGSRGGIYVMGKDKHYLKRMLLNNLEFSHMIPKRGTVLNGLPVFSSTNSKTSSRKYVTYSDGKSVYILQYRTPKKPVGNKRTPKKPMTPPAPLSVKNMRKMGFRSNKIAIRVLRKMKQFDHTANMYSKTTGLKKKA